jgi:hypothetical protein
MLGLRGSPSTIAFAHSYAAFTFRSFELDLLVTSLTALDLSSLDLCPYAQTRKASGGLALAAPGTSFGSKSLDGLGLAMRLCDLSLWYKVAWLIPNDSSVFSNSEQK